jgi:hypothetical protein
MWDYGGHRVATSGSRVAAVPTIHTGVPCPQLACRSSTVLEGVAALSNGRMRKYRFADPLHEREARILEAGYGKSRPVRSY